MSTSINRRRKAGSDRTSEDRIVRLLRRRFGGQTRSLKKGIGDDAAVFHPASGTEYWALTTDLLLEHIDFRKEWTSPRELGHKALAVNLSDLAAMGARPRWALVALGVPRGLRLGDARRLGAGLGVLARACTAGGRRDRSSGRRQVGTAARCRERGSRDRDLSRRARP